MADDATPKMLKVDRRLSQRAPGLKLTPALMAAAEAAMAAAVSGIDFEAYAAPYTRRMRELAVQRLSLAEGPASLAIEAQIDDLAHQLRGMGTTFGFPLITELCGQLARLRQATTECNRRAELIRLHCDAVDLVLRCKLTGDGGDGGQALLAGLAAAILKLQGNSGENTAAPLRDEALT